jgi:hypothetical protein
MILKGCTEQEAAARHENATRQFKRQPRAAAGWLQDGVRLEGLASLKPDKGRRRPFDDPIPRHGAAFARRLIAWPAEPRFNGGMSAPETLTLRDRNRRRALR